MRQKVSVFSIATNIYFDYWVSLYLSAENRLFPDADVTFHVFTNRVEEKTTLGLDSKSIVFHKIEDLRWPEATLKRYELIVNEMSRIDADVLMYLDADMLITDHVYLTSIIDVSKDKMVLVRHPGFWRPRFKARPSFYVGNLVIMVKDIMMKIKIGGIGAWETNDKSTAFVSRKNRKLYYCGGIWLGQKDAVLNFAQNLYNNVSRDFDNSITALWHDESHLNRWASKNLFKELNPTYCFAEGYRNLDGLIGKITAVEKDIKTR